MVPHTYIHLRHALIAVLSVILVAVAASQRLIAPAEAQQELSPPPPTTSTQGNGFWAPAADVLDMAPSQTTTYQATLINRLAEAHRFDFSISSPGHLRSGLQVAVEPLSLDMVQPQTDHRTVSLTISLAPDAIPGLSEIITIRATADSGEWDDFHLRINVLGDDVHNDTAVPIAQPQPLGAVLKEEIANLPLQAATPIWITDSPCQMNGQAGERVSCTAILSHQGTNAATFAVALSNHGTLPHDWEVSIDPEHLTDLPPNQQREVTIAVTIPPHAENGTASFTVEAVNWSTGTSAPLPVNLNVDDAPVDELLALQPAVTWLPSDLSVEIMPGGEATVHAQLTSSSASTVLLSSNASAVGWQDEGPDANLTIIPGPSVAFAENETKDVAFRIRPPPDAMGGSLITLIISAESQANRNQIQQTSNTLTIAVTIGQNTPADTATPTHTPTATTTPTPTPSETPVPQTGAIRWDPPRRAIVIEPGTSQTVRSNLRSDQGGTVKLEWKMNPNLGWTNSQVSITQGDQIEFTAGQNREISVVITTPSNHREKVEIEIRAIAPDGVAENSLLISVEPGSTSGATSTPSANTSFDLTGAQNQREISGEGRPGDEIFYDIRLTNNGNETGIFDIRIARSCGRDISRCSESIVGPNVLTIGAGRSETFQLVVRIPSDARDGAVAVTLLEAELRDSGGMRDQLFINTTVRRRAPTTTPTFGPICRDRYEDDNDMASAKDIGFNLSQPKIQETATRFAEEGDDRRAICPAGDEDWLKFGAVRGKVYTIDILQMAPGLDLTLELFDESGNRVAFNDDFFNRAPDPDPARPADLPAGASPVPNDIAPRIDSWTAPHTGHFYIRVRDAVGGGGIDHTYTIVVNAESYGPTPANVDEVCLDIYEPDGLPEEARLIVSNERQMNRRLCPTGDSDWVTFFAKHPKHYVIYTDTRPYSDNNPVQEQSQAGADTILTLTDRDGVSILDVNDDIPGGNTLDSQIEFSPEVDGFYFVQVKNVGDIGNQFIRYDLVLELCLPNPDIPCGREPGSVTRRDSPPRVAPTAIPAAPTADDEEFSLDPTVTPTLTP